MKDSFLSGPKSILPFELTVYSPTIEEVWKETGLSRLKIEAMISKRWREVFEAVAYETSKYVSSARAHYSFLAARTERNRSFGTTPLYPQR
jgi:hypothetical protein